MMCRFTDGPAVRDCSLPQPSFTWNLSSLRTAPAFPRSRVQTNRSVRLNPIEGSSRPLQPLASRALSSRASLASFVVLPLKLGVDRLSWHEGKKRACGCVEGHYTYIELILSLGTAAQPARAPSGGAPALC